MVKCEGGGKVSQKVTNSSKKEIDQHSIREKGESCKNDVTLERMRGSVEKNHICPWHYELSINSVIFWWGKGEAKN